MKETGSMICAPVPARRFTVSSSQNDIHGGAEAKRSPKPLSKVGAGGDPLQLACCTRIEHRCPAARPYFDLHSGISHSICPRPLVRTAPGAPGQECAKRHCEQRASPTRWPRWCHACAAWQHFFQDICGVGRKPLLLPRSCAPHPWTERDPDQGLGKASASTTCCGRIKSSECP